MFWVMVRELSQFITSLSGSSLTNESLKHNITPYDPQGAQWSNTFYKID